MAYYKRMLHDLKGGWEILSINRIVAETTKHGIWKPGAVKKMLDDGYTVKTLTAEFAKFEKKPYKKVS